jgi:hypothetical protein
LQLIASWRRHRDLPWVNDGEPSLDVLSSSVDAIHTKGGLFRVLGEESRTGIGSGLFNRPMFALWSRKRATVLSAGLRCRDRRGRRLSRGRCRRQWRAIRRLFRTHGTLRLVARLPERGVTHQFGPTVGPA